MPFIELTVAHASILTILAISFERYYAICEPLKAGYVCTKTRAMVICVVCWFIAGLFTRYVMERSLMTALRSRFTAKTKQWLIKALGNPITRLSWLILLPFRKFHDWTLSLRQQHRLSVFSFRSHDWRNTLLGQRQKITLLAVAKRVMMWLSSRGLRWSLPTWKRKTLPARLRRLPSIVPHAAGQFQTTFSVLRTS